MHTMHLMDLGSFAIVAVSQAGAGEHIVLMSQAGVPTLLAPFCSAGRRHGELHLDRQPRSVGHSLDRQMPRGACVCCAGLAAGRRYHGCQGRWPAGGTSPALPSSSICP